MPQNPDLETGKLVLRAFLKERSLLTSMRILYERVGTLFHIPLTSFHPFVVGGPDAIRKVLVTERNKVLWRNTDPVTDLLQQGILVTDGQEHDLYRGLMEPALSHNELPGYTEMMRRQTDRVTALWRDGQTIDMLVESRKIALLIIMEALFSVDFWDDMPHLWTPILKTIAYISPGPWILWRKMPRLGYKKHFKTVDEYLYGIIRSRRESESKHDMLDHLLHAGLDDNCIRDQMLTLLIAGHDTSTALLAWTFYLLGKNPAVMRRLVAELDALLGSQTPSAPSGWQPHLLDEIIKESLRLYPPIHIGNRILAEEMDFGEERHVPAGERLFYSIYLTHRDRTIWENADRFCPERFEHGRKTPSFTYVPFGGGPRACIGAAFGQVEARIAIARLLQTFTFTLTGGNVHAHMGATLEPRPGVKMHVNHRRPSDAQIKHSNNQYP
jgi:cytochrome P450